MSLLYHLAIEEKDNAKEHLFYNAIGGKDKCLTFDVFLQTQNNEKVFDRFVGLKAFLTYEDGQYVNNQDILEVKEDSKLFIDSTPAHIRFRINEVSSHHQGHRFRVMVTPTEMSVPMLLTPVFCAPIEVKSKILKHVRARENDTDVESDRSSVMANKKVKLMQNLNSFPSITAESNFPIASSVKLSKSASNECNTNCDNLSHDSVHTVVDQIIPLIRSIKDTLDHHQIQKRESSLSVPFPILCRLTQNASLFLNDMTMLADLLHHQTDSHKFSQNRKPMSCISETDAAHTVNPDKVALSLLSRVPLTRHRSHVIEPEEQDDPKLDILPSFAFLNSPLQQNTFLTESNL